MFYIENVKMQKSSKIPKNLRIRHFSTTSLLTWGNCNSFNKFMTELYC